MHDAFTDILARDWDTGAEQTTRFAVVGLGGFARHVALPAIEAADYCESTVVVSGDPEKRERLSEEYETTGLTYDEYGAGAGSDRYDAVYVATPNRRHLPHARTAADLGKAVLCEKPLEATPERAWAIVDACRDVPLMTAYRMQADPVLRAVRSFLADGGLGPVVRVIGEFTYPVLTESRGADQWRLDAELAGGGALMDIGVYPLNAARFLLGPALWVDGVTRGDAPFDDVDEHVDFHVGFGDAVGSFAASFSGHAGARLALRGSDGSLEIEDAFQPDTARQLVVERDDERFELRTGTNEVREEFDYFAHARATGVGILPDGVDGARDVALMDAVYESARTGARVSIEGAR